MRHSRKHHHPSRGARTTALFPEIPPAVNASARDVPCAVLLPGILPGVGGRSGGQGNTRHCPIPHAHEHFSNSVVRDGRRRRKRVCRRLHDGCRSLWHQLPRLGLSGEGTECGHSKKSEANSIFFCVKNPPSYLNFALMGPSKLPTASCVCIVSFFDEKSSWNPAENGGTDVYPRSLPAFVQTSVLMVGSIPVEVEAPRTRQLGGRSNHSALLLQAGSCSLPCYLVCFLPDNLVWETTRHM